MPDRVGALHELARVVRDGGRLAVAAWQPLADNPVFDAVTTADTDLGWPTEMAEVGFSLGDPDELLALVRAGGWRDATVVRDELVVPVPTIDAVIERRLHTPGMGDIWTASIDRRARPLAEDRRESLEPYRVGDELIAPSRASLLTPTR